MLIDTDTRTIEGPASDVLGVVYRTTLELLTETGVGQEVADAMAQKMTTRVEAKLAQHGMVTRQVHDHGPDDLRKYSADREDGHGPTNYTGVT